MKEQKFCNWRYKEEDLKAVDKDEKESHVDNSVENDGTLQGNDEQETQVDHHPVFGDQLPDPLGQALQSIR